MTDETREGIREQAARALYEYDYHHPTAAWVWTDVPAWLKDSYFDRADAVLALAAAGVLASPPATERCPTCGSTDRDLTLGPECLFDGEYDRWHDVAVSPPVEHPAEYEQVGWWHENAHLFAPIIEGLPAGASSWVPVYRRVAPPSEGPPI